MALRYVFRPSWLRLPMAGKVASQASSACFDEAVSSWDPTLCESCAPLFPVSPPPPVKRRDDRFRLANNCAAFPLGGQIIFCVVGMSPVTSEQRGFGSLNGPFCSCYNTIQMRHLFGFLTMQIVADTVVVFGVQASYTDHTYGEGRGLKDGAPWVLPRAGTTRA